MDPYTPLKRDPVYHMNTVNENELSAENNAIFASLEKQILFVLRQFASFLWNCFYSSQAVKYKQVSNQDTTHFFMQKRRLQDRNDAQRTLFEQIIQKSSQEWSLECLFFTNFLSQEF